MDMSVKLNTVYPAANKTLNDTTDTSAAVTAAAASTQVASVATSTTTTSTDSVAAADKLGSAVKLIDQFIKASKRDLEFSIDQVRGIAVVKVVATATGEVVRQMPTEEALKLADSLSKAGSVLFDGKV
jgi:flagellar protein FlaG